MPAGLGWMTRWKFELGYVIQQLQLEGQTCIWQCKWNNSGGGMSCNQNANWPSAICVHTMVAIVSMARMRIVFDDGSLSISRVVSVAPTRVL